MGWKVFEESKIFKDDETRSILAFFTSFLAERGRRSDNVDHSTSVEHQDDAIRMR
jgi:hypothetical protein